jgi:putative transposase
MPPRLTRGYAGLVFHALNRSARRLQLFGSADDYRAFLTCLVEAQRKFPLRVLAYCIMPNHFHLVLWPSEDDQLPRFMHRLTSTHAKRWHVRRQSVGTGAVYQSRYKAFPVQCDRHFLNVCRYVERNPLRAGLVGRAEDWAWSSLADRRQADPLMLLTAWPVPEPLEWTALVNGTQPTADVDRIRKSVWTGLPLGDQAWTLETVAVLGLEASTHLPGRPLASMLKRQSG